MKDMTTGRSGPLILKFALPLILGSLFQQFYSLVDAAIVGRTMGAEALASVGSSASIQFMVLGFCMGSCTGFGIPIAQKFGAKDYSSMRKYIYNSLLLGAAMSLVLTVVLSIFCGQILRALSTPENIFAGARDYLFIIFLGIPCTILYNLLSSILRAVGDSRTPFAFLVFSSFLNIGLDFFCILVLCWGVAGAAIATIFSQGLSGLLCAFYMWKKYQFLTPKKEERSLSWSCQKYLAVMGFPMGLQFSITAIGSTFMQSANNKLGSVYVSAYTAALRIKQLMMSPFDGIASGTSTFCSQNLGAGKDDRIRDGLRKGIMIGVGYGLLAAVPLIFFGRNLSMIFLTADESEILDASAQFLRVEGYFFWSLGILNVCRMVTQGLGHAGKAIISGFIEMACRIFVSLVFVPVYGYAAFCFTDETAWIAAAIFNLPMCLWCLKHAKLAK
ncbi:MAG: MATE family efflux transporter [Eubacterium sp.]|nr:MATE family efflux transporter [Eubacterium sp.]